MCKPLWAMLHYRNQETAYAESVRYIVTNAVKKHIESVAVILPDGSAYTVEGTKEQIEISGEVLTTLKTGWPKTIIVVHGHLDQATFSPDDYIFMGEFHSIKQMSVVNRYGRIDSIFPDGAMADLEGFQKQVKGYYCQMHNGISGSVSPADQNSVAWKAQEKLFALMSGIHKWKTTEEIFDMDAGAITEKPRILRSRFDDSDRKKYPIGGGRFMYEIKDDEWLYIEKHKDLIDKYVREAVEEIHA